MRKGIVLVMFVAFGYQPLSLAGSDLLKKYFLKTYESMECMRSPSGLISDKVFVTEDDQPCPIVGGNYFDTSPSNIAFDLLVQVEALQEPSLQITALNNINNNLQVLSQLNYHKASGLFFNRYQVEGSHFPTDLFVSSVDNSHLYLAIWTLSQSPYAFPLAQDLLKRMNLAVFHEPANDLAYGGLEFINNHWHLVAWGYRYFGTEARTLYALAAALDIFPTGKVAKNLVAEIFVDSQIGELFGLWDGGTFQLLLPEILFKESHYSSQFGQWFQNYLSFVEREKARRSLNVLPTHSACQIQAQPDLYNGHLGTLSLVSTFNTDALFPSFRSIWEQVVSPHAAFLLGAVDPERVLPQIEAMETISDGPTSFYNSRIGWLDGLHVTGPLKGKIVSSVLALDQAMIALSVSQMMASDGLISSARLLNQDFSRVKRMNEYYHQLEEVFRSQAMRNLGKSWGI